MKLSRDTGVDDDHSTKKKPHSSDGNAKVALQRWDSQPRFRKKKGDFLCRSAGAQSSSYIPMTVTTTGINVNVANSKLCLHDPTCSGIKSNEHHEHQRWTYMFQSLLAVQ